MMTKKRIFNVPVVKMQLVTAFIFGLVFSFSNNSTAQTIKDDEVLVVADEMPNFPGGTKALMEEINRNITYPDDAVEKRIEGKVIVRFIITKDGKAVQPSISKSLYPSLDVEVIRVIGKLPKFNPGKKGGSPVNVWFAIPVTFKLS
jgi:periplasmic protein TonB